MSRRSTTVTGLLGVGALLVGSALGSTGASLASWSDQAANAAGSSSWGYEYFAAGLPGQVTAAATSGTDTNHTVDVAVDGVGLAGALLSSGKAAQAFQVDALSQGNKGLRYATQWQGAWAAGTPLADPGVTLAYFKVANRAACTPDAVAPSPNPQESTPVSAAYSAGTAVTTEWWCLTARGTTSDAGSHSNTAGATASSANGTVTATPGGRGLTWSASVTTALTAAGQGTRTLRFTYDTFRPGA
ncbi:hypothetical protein C8046_10025 [Serinibacter arcticus]|uniref:Uncharacterized protein n=1 Tax=Serinibacter arcticus TaxID=1655435 RepID=A0A2U1ZVD1_9MICO|nr:hypothetical protein [Serinibacter arcticus]PWD50939.1 hypothetical protein C8046_10025 [Serinibacter arcticus]